MEKELKELISKAREAEWAKMYELLMLSDSSNIEIAKAQGMANGLELALQIIFEYEMKQLKGETGEISSI